MTSTAPRPSPTWDRFDRILRALSIATIVTVVAAAVFGLLGLRTGSTSVANDRMRLEVDFAEVTRSGIATPFRITLTAVGSAPLPADVDIEVSGDYLVMFDVNRIDPQPDSVHFDGETLVWSYQLDGERILTVDVDARLQPDVQRGRDTTITVSAPTVAPLSATVHTTVLG